MEYCCGQSGHIVLIILLIFLGSIIVAHCDQPKLSLNTPNVTILQPVVYQCTVTGVGQGDSVTLRWRVNGISSTSPDDWDPFISTTGITLTSTSIDSILTIPKGTSLNETTVECIVLGIVNGAVYHNSTSHTLYIQGKPTSVHLTCSLYSVYTIQCNWSIPYTIMGISITGYNINITNTSTITVTNTEYYYNVSQFGVYNISVVAVIGDLEGEIDTIMIDVPEVMIDDWSVVYVGSIQTVNSSIMDTQFINIIPVKMVITADNDQYTLDINSYSSIITGELEWSYGREELNVSLMVEYDNGLQVYSSGNRTLNTFHVQNVTINSYLNGTVCFECVFIPGIYNGGCFINFTCSETGLDRNITVNLIGCLYDIVSNYYHIYVYDLESNRTIAEQPAYTTSRMITYSFNTGHNDKSTAIVIGVVAMIAMIILTNVSPDIILC